MTAGAARGFATALAGPAGTLDGLLVLPPGEPRLAAVVCHPHPLLGGNRHSKVVQALVRALVGAGAAALAFNFRGTGASAGSHDHGRGELDDVGAALDHLAGRFPGLELLVAGYSFGAWVGLNRGAADRRVRALIGVGLATRSHDFAALAGATAAKLLVQGDRDEHGPLAEVRALAARLPPPVELTVLAGADHSFEGHLDDLAAAVAAFAGRR
jgi:hypothetical protein